MNELKVLIEYIGIKKILIYFLVINIIGIIAMGVDKYKAKKATSKAINNLVHILLPNFFLSSVFI